jgi:hypothetical protein
LRRGDANEIAFDKDRIAYDRIARIGIYKGSDTASAKVLLHTIDMVRDPADMSLPPGE